MQLEPLDDLPPDESPSWDALGYLFDRSWWTRAWVVREVHTARKVLVMSGPIEIDFSSIGLTAVWLFCMSVREEFYRNAHSSLSKVKNAVCLSAMNLYGITLHDLNFLSKDFDASDPRDKSTLS